MKTKKVLLALLALGAVSTSALAKPSIDSITDKQVTVSCDAATDKSVALTVVRKNYLPSQLEWVVAVKEDIAEDGEAVFQFNMPDTVNDTDIDGEYVVYTKVEGISKESTSFLYVAPGTRAGIKEALQGVTSKDELAAVFNNADNDLALKYMGFDMDSYNALPGEESRDDYKSSTIQTMFDAVGDFADAADDVMTENFEKALIVNYINASEASDDCKNTMGNLAFEDVAYKDIQDEDLKDWISACMFKHKPYDGYEDVLAEYETSNILYKINNSRFSGIKELLETYAEDLGISDHEVYLSYKRKADKGTVNEAIASRLKKKQPQTAEELMDEIDAALKSLSDKGSSSGGSSSGGYSGGVESKPDIVLPVDRNPVEEKSAFEDVANDFWGKNAINKLAEKNIISGDGTGKFRPNDTVTREEFVKMVVSILGNVDNTAECDFEDINKGDWCYKYVASAVNKGIIYGKDESHFGRGEGLSRQDMAVICMRVVADTLTQKREDAVFADEDSISDYAKEAVHKLYCAGIVNGTDNNQFSPFSCATRAEAAQILYMTFYN